MSASPAGPPSGSGPPSTTPGGGPAPPMRRRKPQGPFAAPKSRPKSRPAAQPRATSARPAPPQSAPARATAVPQPPPDDDPSLYDEYPLITTKKALLDGLRHHVMRFTSDKEVNPYSQAENQFQRPIRLQRRFPHDTPNNNVVIPSNPEDDKEREKEAIRKAERQAERDANALLVAPTDKTASKKRKPFKKKVEDVYAPKDTEDAKKRAQLRYDESRPWHLEDFTGKNSWVGKYEAPLSETHAMFVLEDSGAFRMVPLEKWYRFTPTARFATLSLEEAEAHMNKKMKADRWFGHDQDKDAERKRAGLEQQQRMNRGRVGMRGENRAIKGEDDDDYHPELADDADEIDYELNEEFQDDDEDRLFGGDDDEAKESERRIKQERYNANIFAGTGVKEDKDWFDEEEKEKKAAEDERKKAKKLRKALIKKEKNFQYESDSDHPYSSESDSEDSDEERQREEEERTKEEERKANADKLPSGASSKGNNTPSGRAEKHADPLRNKLSSAANLKRPGSPNLSEASGSESAHKRVKKEHGAGSNGRIPQGAATSLPLSLNQRRNIASGSDTEASGPERNKLKRTQALGSTSAAPSAPGTPAHNGGASTTPAGSRSGTPLPPSQSSASAATMPTADEVRAAIPDEGITIKDLVAKFKANIPKGRGNEFIGVVKSVVRQLPGGLVGVKKTAA